MAKKQIYTIPLTLRLSPGMMEYVDAEARKRGLTAIDVIRYAISFMFWESDFVRQQDRQVYDRPVNHLAEFEGLCVQPSNE